MSAGQRSVRVAQVNKIAELEVTCAEQERKLKQLTNERDEAIKQLDDKERQLEIATKDIVAVEKGDLDICAFCDYGDCSKCKYEFICSLWRSHWEEATK